MMQDKMSKLLEKKKKDGKTMPEHEKNAKLGVMEDLHKMASDAMGSKLGGLKKVTVASDSSEGLSHGLDKAKEIMNGNEMQHGLEDAESGNDRGDSVLAGGEDPEGDTSQSELAEEPHGQPMGEPQDASATHMGHHDMGKYDDMSEEDLDHHLQKLSALKHKFKK